MFGSSSASFSWCLCSMYSIFVSAELNLRTHVCVYNWPCVRWIKYLEAISARSLLKWPKFGLTLVFKGTFLLRFSVMQLSSMQLEHKMWPSPGWG